MRYEGEMGSENVEFDRYVIFEWSHMLIVLKQETRHYWG